MQEFYHQQYGYSLKGAQNLILIMKAPVIGLGRRRSTHKPTAANPKPLESYQPERRGDVVVSERESQVGRAYITLTHSTARSLKANSNITLNPITPKH